MGMDLRTPVAFDSTLKSQKMKNSPYKQANAKTL